jgi:hypothetical protein
LALDLANPSWLARTPKRELVAVLCELVPSFRHVETGLSLDQRI